MSSKFVAEVGRKVFIVPKDQRRGKYKEFDERVIMKVGRKWVEYARDGSSNSLGRFEKAAFESDGVADVDAGGYSTRDIAYADMAIRQREVAVISLRNEVREYFDTFRIDKITTDKLIQIADVLGVGHDLSQHASAQPVAVPDGNKKIGNKLVNDSYFLCKCNECGWIGSSEETESGADGETYYCPSCRYESPDELISAAQTFNAMLSAAQKQEGWE